MKVKNLTESLERKLINEVIRMENLNEAAITATPETHTQFIEAIEDFEKWIEEYELDLEDLLYDVFNMANPQAKKSFAKYIIALHDVYKEDIEGIE